MSFKDWKECKLDELIAKRNQGVNTTTEKVKYSEKGIPVIRAQNITPFGLRFDDIVYVSEETFTRVREECKPKKNDLLYTNIGSQFGTACVVDVDYPFLIAWNVLRIQTKKETDPFFLKYVLNNPEIKSMVRGMNSSSTMPFVSGKEIGNIDLLVPEFYVQSRVASILSALDDKIEINRQTNQTLENIAQTIFKEWFVNFHLPYATGEMQNSKSCPIPKGWRVGKLGEVIGFVKGRKPKETSEKYTEGFLPQILIETLDTGKYVFANPANMISSDEDDLLMVMDGASSGRVEFGIKGIVGSTLAVVKKINFDSKYFLFQYLKLREEDIKANATGSSIPHADKHKINDYDFIYPTTAVLKKYEDIVSPLYQLIKKNRIESRTLSNVRDNLLPKLMSGGIEV